MDEISHISQELESYDTTSRRLILVFGWYVIVGVFAQCLYVIGMMICFGEGFLRVEPGTQEAIAYENCFLIKVSPINEKNLGGV